MEFIDNALFRAGARQESALSISAAAHRGHDHLPIVAVDTATGACAEAGAGGAAAAAEIPLQLQLQPLSPSWAGASYYFQSDTVHQHPSRHHGPETHESVQEMRVSKREREKERILYSLKHEKTKETEHSSKKQEIFDGRQQL